MRLALVALVGRASLRERVRLDLQGRLALRGQRVRERLGRVAPRGRVAPLAQQGQEVAVHQDLVGQQERVAQAGLLGLMGHQDQQEAEGW